MLCYIKGTIKNIIISNIILEVQDKGYDLEIISSKSIDFSIDDDVKVYIYHLKNEFIDKTYGFLNLETRKLFIDSLSISSIGTKTATLVLNQYSCEELLLIIKNKEFVKLANIKKVGNHSAKIIIENLQSIYFSKQYNNVQNNVISCLKNLGYSLTIIYKAIEKVDKTLTLDQYLAIALRKVGEYSYVQL